MGLLQVEEPKRIKVGNGPPCLVGAVRFGAPFPVGLTAQYASQSASDESIFRAECLVVPMFEVLKPAAQQFYIRNRTNLRPAAGDLLSNEIHVLSADARLYAIFLPIPHRPLADPPCMKRFSRLTPTYAPPRFRAICSALSGSGYGRGKQTARMLEDVGIGETKSPGSGGGAPGW
jgi:hypothetical protein